MNEYSKIAMKVRKEVSKVTLEQQKEIIKIYTEAIGHIAEKAANAKEETLTKKYLTDFAKDLAAEKAMMIKKINKSTNNSIKKAATLGTKVDELIMRKIFEVADLDPGDNFVNIYSEIPNSVIADIVSGSLYKDKKTLSTRIWQSSDKFERDIQYIINRGIAEKKSSLELAKDLEKFVKEPAKRPWSWSKVYPQLVGTIVDYNAQRLARTSINHAYQNSTIQSCKPNPFIEGIEWHSAMIHGRTCEICRERHGEIFPKDDVPLDHPNGLCTMLPYIPKDTMTVATELRVWLDGENNPILDEWYQEYGLYFAFKKL